MGTKKTMYHGELRGFGRCTVDVLGEVVPSKYKHGTFVVSLGVNGEQRTYQCENQTCATRFQGRNRQRLAIEAVGGGRGQEATADVVIHAADWTPAGQAPPPPSQQPPQQAGPQPGQPAGPPPQQPPAQQPPAQQPPPAQPAQQPPQQPSQAAGGPQPNGPRQPALNVNSRLFQIANLELRIQCAAHAAAEELKNKRGIVMTPESHAGLIGRTFIQLSREGYLDVMPHNHLIDLTPKQAAQTQAAQTPPAQPQQAAPAPAAPPAQAAPPQQPAQPTAGPGE